MCYAARSTYWCSAEGAFPGAFCLRGREVVGRRVTVSQDVEQGYARCVCRILHLSASCAEKAAIAYLEASLVVTGTLWYLKRVGLAAKELEVGRQPRDPASVGDS